MKLLDFIPLSKTNKALISLVGQKLGYHPDVIDSHMELIETFLKGAQESGKYETFGDLWKDDELKSNLVEFFSSSEAVRDSVHPSIDINSTITCVKCGYEQKLCELPAIKSHLGINDNNVVEFTGKDK